uniref:Uncharacterized protein n=1 Tax=Anguilla anguilla TaxID=7936 RepID=A0A0E9TY58_ANGAN
MSVARSWVLSQDIRHPPPPLREVSS